MFFRHRVSKPIHCSAATFLYNSLRLCVSAVIFVVSAYAQTTDPRSPDKDAEWLSAAKQAIGTSANPESKVWFTLANGVLTEVLYPNVQTAQVQMLQFVVVNPKTKKVETEWDDAHHQIKALRSDSLSFQQINTAKSGEWKITKTYATDPRRAVVLIDVRFEPKDPACELYVYFDPSIGNSGMGDTADHTHVSHPSMSMLEARDAATPYRSELFFTSPISNLYSGFSGDEAGLAQLRKGETPTPGAAENGNIVQMVRIDKPARFTAFLAFGDRRTVPSETIGSIDKSFENSLAEYDKGWADFVKTLRVLAAS